MLIALTHMRVPNDLRLAREVPELHMVLGGHDHHYETEMVILTTTPPAPRPPSLATFDLFDQTATPPFQIHL